MNETWSESVRDYIRAAGGGLIIGLPLLFTMEVWFHGFILPWWKLLLLLGVAYGVVIGYNAIAGFRRERTLGELVIDSTAAVIEATATVDSETETSEQEINFLPAGTEVELAFAFSAAPEGGVTFRLVGYRVP